MPNTLIMQWIFLEMRERTLSTSLDLLICKEVQASPRSKESG